MVKINRLFNKPTIVVSVSYTHLKITAMIAAVGFYEHTGDWMYTSGIPAKTGVGGGVMGVVPGQFGIAAFAPPLDGAGTVSYTHL